MTEKVSKQSTDIILVSVSKLLLTIASIVKVLSIILKKYVLFTKFDGG